MSTVPFSGSIDVQALAAALQPILDARYLGQSAPAPTPTPTPTPVPAGAFWVYQNGVFAWAGDYSFSTGPIDYANTVGKPGGKCISVPIASPWGGFQPYAPGGQFDTRPYKYLTYSLKPTQPNAVFATGFAAINDVADGSPITVVGPGLTKYGPAPQVGVWGTYKIPLADFGLSNPLILKFSVADGTGVKSNQFYLDNIGFSS